MTIASNYKIKNPDIIFAPAKSSPTLPDKIETQEDLDKFLEQIKANNV